MVVDYQHSDFKPDAAQTALDAALAAGQECHAAALRYQALGWPVLWLCPPDHIGVGRTHGKSCTSPGKAPSGPWKEFQTRLPTQDELRAKYHDLPNGNVGVALGGPGRLVRLDIEGAAGEARLAELSRGDLLPTPEFKSGRKDGTGRGLLYAIPEGQTWRTRVEGLGIGAELRVQALGAQTVLPPSRHKDGGRYAWLPGRSPWEVAPAPAPAWLVGLMLGRGGTRTGGASHGPKAKPLGDGELIYFGHRDSTLTRIAGAMRRQGLDAAEMLPSLLAVNEARCDPPLEEAQVRKIAGSVAGYDPAAVPRAVFGRAHCGAEESIRFSLRVE